MSAEVPFRNSLLIDGIRVAGKLGSGTSPPWDVPNMSPSVSVTGAAQRPPFLLPQAWLGLSCGLKGFVSCGLDLSFAVTSLVLSFPPHPGWL